MRHRYGAAKRGRGRRLVPLVGAALFALAAGSPFLRASSRQPLPPATPAPRPTPSPLVPKAPPAGGRVLLEEHFLGPDGLVTSHVHYADAPFPGRGRSRPSNPSPVWEGGSGALFRDGGWGWSGRPREWGDRYFFRMVTRASDIGDAVFSWRYRSGGFGENGFPVQGPDAVDLWLRYRTQYDLYALQFDRTNDGVQTKRKVPAQGWKGPSSLLANKGVYYTLRTDSEQPVLGAGHGFVPWSAVRELLPASERAKPRFPNLAHDRVTPYDFTVVARNVPGGRVQIQAFRAGVLVYSATDDGRSPFAATGETLGEHLDRGWFGSVRGWRPSWGAPISEPGATGFRADNVEMWITDFVVRSLD